MRFAIFLLIPVFFLSCSHAGKRETGPGLSRDSIIPRETLVRITADVHIAEAVARLHRLSGTGNKEDLDRYFRFIWAKYHVTRSQFLGNLDRLKRDPADFGKFYDEVIADLNQRSGKSLPEEE